MTLLIASVAEREAERMVRSAEAAWSGGAEAVELRIDAVQGEIVPVSAYVRSHPERKWIITCRQEIDGGGFCGSVQEQIARLLQVAQGPNTYVDFEFHLLEAGGLQVTRLRDGLAACGAKLLPSQHLSEWTAHSLADLAQRMSRSGAPAFKIAYTGSDAADGFHAADLMHEYGPRIIAVAMGEACGWTRILARKLGALGTFCTPISSGATAPGQLTLEDMLERFAWRRTREFTSVYGVVGDPVAQSLSPLLFNHWFHRHQFDAIYVPFHVRTRVRAVAEFLECCAARPWLKVCGHSVTIPHKEAVRQWLAGGADSMSRTIGAVNAICFRDSAVTGHNTDCYAAVDSLAAALGCGRLGLTGKRIDVLGAGGAARAIVTGLVEMGAQVTLFARDECKSKALARELLCAAQSWEARGLNPAEALVNTTPVGMWPRTVDSPMPAERLAGYTLVFDMIYRPVRTQLLIEAARAGCRTLNGLDMFVRQAAMQFELWTGTKPDKAAALALLAPEIASPDP